MAANAITYDDFTADQKQASEMLLDWYGQKSPRFCLAGFAGTGKSTLISQLPRLIKNKTSKLPQIGYCAYTGKAAQVLNRKGIPASTIHSTIYDARVVFDEKTKKFVHEYSLKMSIPYDLIVVDEASMVNADIYNDLMSFGIPVIYVGDSGQLPPVEGKFNLMDEQNVDYTLQQIHRQAEKSNIIRLSVAIRNGDRIADHEMEDVCKKPWSSFDTSEMFKYRQVIAGKNITRVGVNKLYRKALGYPDAEPVGKDTMIFLRNNHTAGVVNGQQIYIEGITKRKDGNYDVSYRDLWNPKDGKKTAVASWRMLNNPEPMNNLRITKEEARMKELTYFDFSYCISVHKCVVGETLIKTAKGELPIAEYVDRQMKDAVFNGEEFETPANAFRYEDCEVMTIKTANGKELTATLNHKQPILINGKLVKVNFNKLRIGDEVLTDKGISSIADIRKGGEKKTVYCLEMLKTHAFMQNGILSGNSQGDGWKSVLFLDDNLFFFDADMRRKLLYTAVTRAEERLTWVYGVPRGI